MSDTQLQLHSTVTAQGVLRLTLAEVEIPKPKPGYVLVKVEASPINPSDLGLLFGPADMATAQASGTAAAPIIEAKVPEKLLAGLAPRFDQAMPVGNEGAGVVTAAGDDESQGLVGKTVSIIGGAMYSQYRMIKAKECLVLPDDATAVDGASWFVNPLTALGMVETMKTEGHSALVHTAAASNLGQMLNKICLNDGVELVNVVRKPEQVELLRGLGAKHIVNSSSDNFADELTQALAATNATIAFDATGGGRLAGDILSGMERAANLNAKEYSRYGSSTFKQVYIYGGLDRNPTTLNRNFGLSWSLGGWLLTPFLQKIGPAAGQALRERVAREIKTTFASHYTQEVSLAQALTLDSIGVYGKQATGEKFLIRPNKDL